MDVEDVFSSRLRMRILKLMFHLGELNVSEIARRLGSNYEATNAHLKILEAEGILQRKDFGRIHLYRISQQSAKAAAIRDLLDVWDQKKAVKT